MSLRHRRTCHLLAIALVLAFNLPVRAAGDEVPEPPSSKATPGVKMDYGPFICYSVLKPRPATQPAAKSAGPKPATPKAAPKPSTPKAEKEGNPAYPWKPEELLATKGVTVKVGHGAAIVFDTDTCRYAGGWTGGFLDLTHCNLGKDKGDLPAFAQGTLQFTTADAPGWSHADSFKDPRADQRGPLPADWLRYKGLYRDGDRIVFSYTVGVSNVLDEPGTCSSAKQIGYTRTIRIDQSTAPLAIAVCDVDGTPTVKGNTASVVGKDGTLCVGVLGAPEGAALEVNGNQIHLKLLTLREPATFTLVMAKLPKDQGEEFSSLLLGAGKPEDPTVHTKGGPARWKEEITTGGTLGTSKEGYVLDTIKLPDQNPWSSWMRLGALDFFSDGRCAVSTWNGDVWIVSNIDDKLDQVKWKRFATGLYEPLGLKIVDDVAYVTCRDGIYRLRDLNQDGEADFYECFNNDAVCSANYHGFAFDLQTDKDGNFYYVTCGNGEPLSSKDHGGLYKVSKDGQKFETFATGFRAPNGMSIGPNDEIVVGDNQGQWTPASKINWVKKGGFYGFEGDPRKLTKADQEYMKSMHPTFDRPLCWIPYKWDNSSAGQVWATSEKWGPLAGHMLHLSYGAGTLFEVMYETVGGVMQGGVVQIPLKFDSGAMRARVSPVDGQIYVVGLKGWQSAGNKHGCFQRVRYAGKAVHLPNELHVTEKGIFIGFASPLDPETANDADSFGIEAFVYKHWSTYGSPDFKASNPTEKGHDVIAVKSAKLQADQRTVFLEIPGLKPVEQMTIKIDLKAADGAPIKCEIGNTINKLGKDGGD